jgi:hypothetical protein
MVRKTCSSWIRSPTVRDLMYTSTEPSQSAADAAICSTYRGSLGLYNAVTSQSADLDIISDNLDQVCRSRRAWPCKRWAGGILVYRI